MYNVVVLLLVALCSVEGFCPREQFRCHSGLCIPMKARCDGRRDCPGGEDELHCPPINRPCPREQLRCHSGLCIPMNARCDGRRDCPGGEDELDCPPIDRFRPREQLRCHSGLCIPMNARCDGRRDCPGGEDELDCPPINRICPREQFKCHSGLCIPMKTRCDGRRDCPGGEDELDCPPINRPCPREQLKCHSGLCIPMNARCNGRRDCRGGEDELDCLSNNGSCRRDELKCRSGHCLPMSVRCDGCHDCPGGDDELHCSSKGMNLSCTCSIPVKIYSSTHPLKKVTWFAAKKHCEKEGKKLATVKNQVEQDLLEELMINNGLEHENVWLGLSKHKGNEHFRWEDGTYLVDTTFENWKPGEPTNEFYYYRESVKYIENCVHANGKDQFWPRSRRFQWNDVPCDDDHLHLNTLSYVICEHFECRKV